MAHAQELIEWSMLNAEALSIDIKNSTWINEISTSFSDVTVQISMHGENFLGYGGAPEHDLALTKAIAEAVERSVVKAADLSTSNGVAAHFDPEAATRAAEQELRERDYFLCHFYTFTPFNSIECEFPGLDKLGGWYKRLNVAYRTFSLGDGVLFVADGRARKQGPFGFALGAACKGVDSATSAAIEASRQVAHMVAKNNLFKPHRLDEFLQLDRPSFFDHGLLAFDVSYAQRIAPLFEGGEAMKYTDVPAAITVQSLPTPEGLPSRCPLAFVRASSVDLQDMHPGVPTPGNINLPRLSRFCGRELTYADIFKLPHPFN
jgi:hypothetical protein